MMMEFKSDNPAKEGAKDETIVFNARGQIAGRLGAHVAKALLSGKNVAVIEVQDAVISGGLAHQVDRLQGKRNMKAKYDPSKSPKFPRVPHLMFKRLVRGMLPKKTQIGRDALHRLRVYSGIPAGVDAASAQKLDVSKNALLKSTTIGRLCAAFGYKEPQ